MNNDIKSYLNKGKELMLKSDYYAAIEIFKSGFSISSNELFNLYIAACYFKNNDYLNAMTYLKSYENTGKEYLEICYLFLAAIYMENKDNKNCYYYYQKFLGKDEVNNREISNGIIESYNKLINTKVEHAYKLIMQ